MLMIGLPGPAAALGLGAAAARARRQVARRAAGRAAARRPGGWRRASMSIRSTGIAPTSRSAHLPALARAVLDQRRVAMRYESWTGVRDWRIEPLGLVLKARRLVSRRARRAARSGPSASRTSSSRRSGERASSGRPISICRPGGRPSLERFEAELRPGVADAARLAGRAEAAGRSSAPMRPRRCEAAGRARRRRLVAARSARSRRRSRRRWPCSASARRSR